MVRKSEPVLKYVNTWPAELATLEQLAAEGLKPTGKVAALVTIRTPNSERLTGLYRRDEVKPMEAAS